MDLPERVEAVIDSVCRKRGVKRETVMSRLRTGYITDTRDEIWWRLHQLTTPGGKNFSTTMIGQWFGRDHSSVSLGIKRFEVIILDMGPVLQAQYEDQRRARKAELLAVGDIAA